MAWKTLILVVFTVAFIAGFVTGPVGEAGAAECLYTCSTYSYTATMTGHGIDCTHAQADLEAQLDAAVEGECQDGFKEVGFCSREVVITSPCSCNDCCDYEVSGYLKYRCLLCIPDLTDPVDP